MTFARVEIAEWPALSDDLAALLGHIDTEGESGPRHSRPWDLARLPDKLVEPVWSWLDRVVRWLNEHCAWKAENVIPPCWPQHAHLALELALLAFARQPAMRSNVPADLQQWHNDLAAFHVRMREAFGDAGLKDCQRGKHRQRPSDYELALYDVSAARACIT